MTRPLDRNCRLPEIGAVDRAAGEFWAENPFDMIRRGDNLSAYERNRLYLNVAGKTFVDASFASNADLDADSRSVVAADFDGDGKEDLLVASAGGGPLRLLHNRFPGPPRGLRVRLIGTDCNRSGVGARVVAHLGSRRLVRDLFPANGCLGSGPAEVFLGLGDATRIDRIDIRWPSGGTQAIENITPSEVPNRLLTITQTPDRSS